MFEILGHLLYHVITELPVFIYKFKHVSLLVNELEIIIVVKQVMWNIPNCDPIETVAEPLSCWT